VCYIKLLGSNLLGGGYSVSVYFRDIAILRCIVELFFGVVFDLDDSWFHYLVTPDYLYNDAYRLLLLLIYNVIFDTDQLCYSSLLM
jgi:hypothetical protein